MNNVAVVIVNYCTSQDVLKCLHALLQSNYPVKNVFLVDNASPDDSFARLVDGLAADETLLRKQWRLWWPATEPSFRTLESDGAFFGIAPGVALVQSGCNRGFAAGNNFILSRLATISNFDYFWLLNPDTMPSSTALSELMAEAARMPSVGLIGSTLVYGPIGNPLIQSLGGGTLNALTARTAHLGAFKTFTTPASLQELVKKEKVREKMTYVVGASMFASTEWIRKVGLLSEDYFLYYEEVDWAFRGRKHLEIGYAPASVVYHTEGASIGTAPSGGSTLSIFHLARSRVIFCRRNLGTVAIGAALAALTIGQLKFLLKGRFKLAAASFRGSLSGLAVEFAKKPLPDR